MITNLIRHKQENKVGLILDYKRSVSLTTGVLQPRSCSVMGSLRWSLS